MKGINSKAHCYAIVDKACLSGYESNKPTPSDRSCNNCGQSILGYSLSASVLLGLMVLSVLFPVYAMASSVTTDLETVIPIESRYQEVTQGVLRYQQGGQQYESLPLSTDVTMNVSGWTNRVSVKQTFMNNSSEWINGTYVFPLSHNSAVDSMRLIIGDRSIEGVIQPKKQAKANFEKAKSQGKRASLVSQQRPNIFTTEIANLGPSETAIVEITYQEKLNYKEGMFSLRFPMTITPRYTPAHLQRQDSQQDLASSAEKSNADIKQHSYLSYQSLSSKLPDSVTRYLPEYFIDETQSEILSDPYLQQDLNVGLEESNHNALMVNMTVNLDAGFDVKAEAITSPYHKIAKVRQAAQVQSFSNHQQWLVSFAKPEKANKDFVLQWRAEHQESYQPIAAVFSQQGQTHQKKTDSANSKNDNSPHVSGLKDVQYDLVMLSPPLISEKHTEDTSHTPRELILVIDTSGSMQGAALSQAKQSILYALAGLRAQDKFNIYEFNHNVNRLSQQSLAGTSSNIGRAHQFVKGLQANGGTEIGKALSAALQVEQAQAVSDISHFLRQVIFITDGAVSNEHGIFQQIEAELGQSRLFTVGIGAAPNSYFMERAALFGRGTFTYIGNTSEVNQKITKLMAKIEKPVATNVSLTYADGTIPDYWPAQIPDLYTNEPILVSVKSPAYNQQDFIVSGYTQGQYWQKQIKRQDNTSASHNASGLDLLWANAQIQAIEATRTQANQQRIKKQVEALGMKYHLVTSQTSLVAIDTTPVKPMAEMAVQKQVKRHLPAGRNQSVGVLPQTATSSRLNVLIGLSLLLIALLNACWLKGYLPGQKLILPKKPNEEACL